MDDFSISAFFFIPFFRFVKPFFLCRKIEKLTKKYTFLQANFSCLLVLYYHILNDIATPFPKFLAKIQFTIKYTFL